MSIIFSKIFSLNNVNWKNIYRLTSQPLLNYK